MLGNDEHKDTFTYTHTHTHTPQNSSPTSVFKVYNSSMGKAAVFPSGDISPFFFHRGPDIFTWAVTQQIAHDHSYCKASDAPQESLIDHGTITMKNIQW